jgi:hypothetical protein
MTKPQQIRYYQGIQSKPRPFADGQQQALNFFRRWRLPFAGHGQASTPNYRHASLGCMFAQALGVA